MAHAVSASAIRSDRMSPSALALAVLLHVLVALALLWAAQNRPPLPPAEDRIDITFEQPREQPKPPEPPPPKKAPEPPPAPPVDLGLRPPAPLTSDKPTQVPPAPTASKEAPAPSPPPQREAAPAPQPPQPPPTPSPAPAEPAAPAGRLPPAQAHVPPPPTRPPPPAPRPELRPSPLTPAPQRRPPAAASAAEQPSPHPFVNPADAYNKARVADNYLWQVVRKLAGYRYQADVSAREGLTVVRVVIARDGRLLDIDIARSSGIPEFDRGVVAGVRAGSPYAPLPPEIKGDRATFNLPLVSTRRQ